MLCGLVVAATIVGASRGLVGFQGADAWPFEVVGRIARWWPLARKPVLSHPVTHMRVFDLRQDPKPLEFEVPCGNGELRPSPDGMWCLLEDGGDVVAVNLKSGRFRRTSISTKGSVIWFQGFSFDGSEAVYLAVDLVGTPRPTAAAVRIVCVSLEKGTSRDVAALTVGSGEGMPSMYAAVRRNVEPEWAMFIADGPEGGTLAFGGPGQRRDVVVTQTHATEPTFFGRFAPDGSFMLGPWRRISIPEGKMTPVQAVHATTWADRNALSKGYLETPDGREFRLDTLSHGLGWGSKAVFSPDGNWCATETGDYMGTGPGIKYTFQVYRIPDKKPEPSGEP
jgi:hypothetical protein